ncbi:unnamed protein product [Musa banksii]
MGANTKEPVESNFQLLEVITQSLLNTVAEPIAIRVDNEQHYLDILRHLHGRRRRRKSGRRESMLRMGLPPPESCRHLLTSSPPMLRGLVRTSPRHRRRRRYQLGGIARKIRIYSLRTLLPPEGHAGGAAAFYGHSTACDFYICTPAKLGSLRWLPASGCRVLGSGDYDGVVTESDEERRVEVFERDEHAGRHVRSWDTRRGGKGCVGVARPGAAVCGVEFDPGGGPWVGVGSDDRHAYVYDVRAVSAVPVAVLAVHGCAVTYVRFAGGPGRAVVSSGTDGSHRLWDWVGGGGGGGVEEVRAYSGHANALRFVGMSVWRTGGLVYDLRLEESQFGCGASRSTGGKRRAGSSAPSAGGKQRRRRRRRHQKFSPADRTGPYRPSFASSAACWANLPFLWPKEGGIKVGNSSTGERNGFHLDRFDSK